MHCSIEALFENRLHTKFHKYLPSIAGVELIPISIEMEGKTKFVTCFMRNYLNIIKLYHEAYFVFII